MSVGGTSVACPMVAGVLVLANQLRFNAAKPPLTTVYTNTPNSNAVPPAASIPQTLVQNFLYTIYQSSLKPPTGSTNLYSTCCCDIIQGTDGNYTASKGYDIATGLGSLNPRPLCIALASL
jgi:subtilase family serine protease